MILNLTRKTILSNTPRRAAGFSERLFGMIGRKFIDFDAMVFDHCNAIHTCFMTEPVDVIFVSKDVKVLKTVQNLSPWRPFVYCKNAFYVIELPPGIISCTGTGEGDRLDLACVLKPELEKSLARANAGMAPSSPETAVPLETKG
ncbi:MAG: hypothetical protein BWY31_01315 [Lentisphaerae bacterium ADurb.Bin242]|nr:MAG: hypothetical protein BWY31_01315 [Lentisphaerae bacterium ADurb.Bin242]